LNCGLGSGDKKENVLKNLNLVSQKIGCKDELLITLNQSHSNKVVYLENKSSIKHNFVAVALI
jgi:copper oxidase (laccase) domain-containing protein